VAVLQVDWHEQQLLLAQRNTPISCVSSLTRLPPVTPCLPPSITYLSQISVSDFLTLFAARTHHGLFFSMRPGLYLSIGAALALTVSTILACVWPESNEDGLPTRGLVVQSKNPLYAYNHYTLWPLWIWIYCFVWFIIQDVVKLFIYWILRKFNVFQINTSKMVNNREATTFANNPMARASAGMVEGKLLEMKVRGAGGTGPGWWGVGWQPVGGWGCGLAVVCGMQSWGRGGATRCWVTRCHLLSHQAHPSRCALSTHAHMPPCAHHPMQQHVVPVCPTLSTHPSLALTFSPRPFPILSTNHPTHRWRRRWRA
jgi:hypothetical protein